jgi:hypothetical protein
MNHKQRNTTWIMGAEAPSRETGIAHSAQLLYRGGGVLSGERDCPTLLSVRIPPPCTAEQHFSHSRRPRVTCDRVIRMHTSGIVCLLLVVLCFTQYAGHVDQCHFREVEHKAKYRLREWVHKLSHRPGHIVGWRRPFRSIRGHPLYEDDLLWLDSPLLPPSGQWRHEELRALGRALRACLKEVRSMLKAVVWRW